MSIIQNPKILLRGVDHLDIWERYCNGEFDNVSKIHNKTGEMAVANFDLKVNNSNYNNNYTGHSLKILKSGSLKIETENGEELKPQEFFCSWTREKIIGIPVLIPIKMRYDFINEKTIFTVLGSNPNDYHDYRFKNFENALAFLTSNNREKFSSPLFKDSIRLLYNIFEILYPGEKLIKANHWTKHVNFGGSMSENFDNYDHRYYDTSIIEIVPSNTKYIQK